MLQFKQLHNFNFVNGILQPHFLPLIIGTLFFLCWTNNAQAQLTINKTVDKPTVLSGELFTYTLQYRCANITDPCTNVSITDVLPVGIKFYDLTGSVHTIGQTGTYDSNNRTVTFDFIDPLPAGSTGDLTITCFFPNGSTPDGTVVTNTATITDGVNPVTSNPVTVTSSASGTLFCPSMTVTQQGAVGYATQYQVTVPTGAGSYNAAMGVLFPQDVTVVMNLPAGATFVSAGNLFGTSSTCRVT